jgi:hypothetical protein
MSNFYCDFSVVGDPSEIESLKKALDDLWCNVEIQESSHDRVAARTRLGGLLADGWQSVETMVAQFPALTFFNGTIWTTRHREYDWKFEGLDGATTWREVYLEEIAESETRIRAHCAANEEISAAIYKLANGCAGMSAVEVAETEARVNASYAAFRAKELREAAELGLRAAEDCVDPVELESQIRDALQRLSASSPIAGTQDGNSP